jgi:hypothetical protein
MAQKQIKQFTEETAPVAGDMYLMQKASNDETVKVDAENVIPDGTVTPAKIAVGSISAMGVLDISTTGNKTVSGLGFAPSRVAFTWGRTTSNSFVAMGFGFMTSTIQTAYGGQWRGSGSVEGAGEKSSSHCLISRNQSGTTVIAATRVSLNSDGFTINVSTASSTTVPDVVWEAYI